MEWPPIPSQVMGLLGPITVQVVEQAVDDFGTPCAGTWRAHTRTIEITRSPHPANEWWTYYHELTHSYFDDLRIDLPLAKEEAICNGLGLARVREMQD